MNKKLEKTHYDYCVETIAFTRGITEHFIVLGERLARIRQEDLYKPAWDSWQDFLEELRMTESTASRLVNIYLKFIVQFSIPKEKLLSLGGWSDLGDILPYADTKQKAIQLIDKLAPLNRQHRRMTLLEIKTGKTSEQCVHEWYDIHIRQCRLCGVREKIYEEN